MRSGSRHRRLRLETLEPRRLLAGDFELLADVNATPASYSSSPRNFATVGSVTLFVATTGNEGAELWRTDGTAAGTALVKDINPGPATGVDELQPLVVFNGAAYFTANDGVSGAELWRTDGTETGTMRVADLGLGSSSSTPRGMVEFGGSLYFTSSSGLYRTDGNAAGTTLVRAASNAANLIAANGRMYFRSNTGSFYTLWKSDGTAAGTSSLANNVVPSLATGTWAEVGSLLYFQASGGNTGSELWRTDGTAAGTYLVKDIFVGSSSSPANLVNLNGTLYFHATDATHGRELWRSDGTEQGTVLAHEFAASTRSSFSATLPSRQTLVHDGRLYVATGNLGNGAQGAADALWAIDAPGAAPVQLSPTANLFQNSIELVRQPTVFLGEVYFAGVGPEGVELWRTSGTPATTTLVADIAAGADSSGPNLLHAAGGTLYFSAGLNATSGIELFKSDGTAGGTGLVGDLRTSTSDADPREIVRSGDYVYFTADDGVNNRELWRTDGTAAGTTRITDQPTPPYSGSPYNLTDAQGTLFFTADLGLAPESFAKLHRLDAQGNPVLVLDAGGASVTVAGTMIAVGPRVYFTSYTEATGYELWMSDGTPAGTHQVLETNPGPGDGAPQGTTFGRLGDLLFYGAIHPDYGFELWRTDGTPAGTQLVKDIGPGTDGIVAENFTVLDGHLYFIARDFSGNRALWRTDGTEAGTTLINAINRRSSSSYSNPYLAAANGTVYFTALAHPLSSDEVIWRMNAAGDGVEIAADVTEFFSASLYGLKAHENVLYFFSDGFTQDDGYWRYDGATPPVKLSPTTFWEGDLPTPIASGSSLYYNYRASIANEEGVVYELDAAAGTFAPAAEFPTVSTLVVVDGALVVATRREPLGREIFISRPGAGDYDADDTVEGFDFLAWQRAFGGGVALAGSGADGDGDRDVDVADLAVWSAAFGAPTTTAATSSASAALTVAAVDQALNDFAAASLLAQGGDADGDLLPSTRTRPARRRLFA